MFDAIVWDQLLAYAPYPWGLALNPSIRTQLWTAIVIRSDGPLPKPRRVVTLTAEQAEELEVWLAAIVDRPDAPVGIRDALDAVREARRHAQ